jgi:hypothetical protein
MSVRRPSSAELFLLAFEPARTLVCDGARGKDWEFLADVFISYSRLDEARVQPIAERLNSLGYSVWRQPSARFDRNEIELLEREMENAKAVLAVWSGRARNATWVYAASAWALEDEKLLQLRLDDVRLPQPFDALQVADVGGDRSEWGKLEGALARLVRERRAPDPIELVRAPRRLLPAACGSALAVTLGATLTLAAAALATGLALNSVLTPDQLQRAAASALGVAGLCAAFSALHYWRLRRTGG